MSEIPKPIGSIAPSQKEYLHKTEEDNFNHCILGDARHAAAISSSSGLWYWIRAQQKFPVMVLLLPVAGHGPQRACAEDLKRLLLPQLLTLLTCKSVPRSRALRWSPALGPARQRRRSIEAASGRTRRSSARGHASGMETSAGVKMAVGAQAGQQVGWLCPNRRKQLMHAILGWQYRLARVEFTQQVVGAHLVVTLQ